MTELEIANSICLEKLRVTDDTRFVNDPRDAYPSHLTAAQMLANAFVSHLTAAQMLANAFVSQLRGSRRDGFNAGKAHAVEIVKAAGYPDLAEKILKGTP